ncbi:hypothetical protein B9Z55_017100 [Caenorhabditis nigoni]|uniref:Uncharacterized protein n=1 Tax=Caenorhabditis nigoni TaxID=1611254 RepID=A0A2G5T8G8_9PELO|nr:hypothetical protein B9Z55_017100 [Caenorhabditis nigoni]
MDGNKMTQPDEQVTLPPFTRSLILSIPPTTLVRATAWTDSGVVQSPLLGRFEGLSFFGGEPWEIHSLYMRPSSSSEPEEVPKEETKFKRPKNPVVKVEEDEYGVSSTTKTKRVFKMSPMVAAKICEKCEAEAVKPEPRSPSIPRVTRDDSWIDGSTENALNFHMLLVMWLNTTN